MSAKSTSTKITLEDIAQRKEKVLTEIRLQQQQMGNTARKIFAPFAAVGQSGSSFMKTFSTGFAIFDGAVLGLKIIRKIRKLFRR